jgi:hypothetical protein
MDYGSTVDRDGYAEQLPWNIALLNWIQPAPKQLHKCFHYTAVYTISPDSASRIFQPLYCSTAPSPHVQQVYSEDAKLARVRCPRTIMLTHIFLYNGPFAQPFSAVMDAQTCAQVFRARHIIIICCFVLFVTTAVPKAEESGYAFELNWEDLMCCKDAYLKRCTSP